MEKEQALQIIKQDVEQYRGTLKEHEQLQQAIKVIEQEVGLNG